jgi:hypothetical protein
MRWQDERYVRLYTRDTVDWLALSFEAQALLALLLRKADRAGVIKLGRHGKRGVAAAIGHAHRWDILEPALEELLTDGVVVLQGEALIYRNYIEAQETKQSDKARKQAQRERDRALFLAEGNPEATSDDAIRKVAEMSREHERSSQNVTACDETPPSGHDMSSHAVTGGHDASHDVTSGHTESLRAVPCRAVPEKEPPAGARTRSNTEATESPFFASSPHPTPNSPAPQVADPQSRELPRKAPSASAIGRDDATPLRDRMDAVWLEKHGKAFVWRFADEQAMHPVLALAKGDESEVLSRWRRAVAWEGFPQCGAVTDLVKHWNTYGTEQRRPVGRGRASSDSGRDWSKPQKTIQTEFGEELDLGGGS